MNVTINRADNLVSVEGESYSVDCSALPAYVSVIQWKGDKGWIEFQQDGSGAFMPNTPIASIAPYQHILDRWQENKAVAAEAARKEREKLEKIARCQTEVQEIVAEMRANLAAAQEKAGGRALSAEEVAEANPVNGKLQARLQAAQDRLKSAVEAA